jgi:NADH dehydrogenase
MLHPDRVKAPDRGRDLFGTGPRLEAIAGDIRNTRSVIDAVTGAHGVVNAISLYIERGTETFRTVHCAERVAVEANRGLMT